MGIRAETAEFETKAIDGRYAGLRWCEFGNQRFRTPPESSKAVYLRRGVREHISIDINARDGALPLDLDRPLPGSLGVFDVVTNYGTLEHVENQYQGWRNLHDICVLGGLMIHALPAGGPHRKRHGRYLYTLEFVRRLAKACGDIVTADGVCGDLVVSGLVYAAVRRRGKVFVSPVKFENIFQRWVQDTKFTGMMGDYTKR